MIEKFLIVLLLSCPAWSVGFSAPGANDHCHAEVSLGTTFGCTLGAAPASGSVVAVFIQTFQGLTLTGVQDGATTAYTLPIPSCENTFDSNAGTACVAYYIPTGTGDATITATISGGICVYCSITVAVFGVSGGAAAFNNSLNGSGTNTVNTPTITVPGADTLLWGVCTNGNVCTGVTGSWTIDPSGQGTAGEMAEYQLAASADTAVGFTGGGVAQQYDAMGMSFTFTPSAVGRKKNASVTG